MSYWPSILFLALIANVIGIYLLQVGIKKSSMLTVSYLKTLMPISYAFSELFSDRIQLKLGSCLLIFFTVLLVLYLVYLKNQQLDARKIA